MENYLTRDNDAFMEHLSAAMESQPRLFGIDQSQQVQASQTNATHEGATESNAAGGSGMEAPSNQVKKKGKYRAINRPRWGKTGKEILSFNKFGQAISPHENVAKYGRFLAMLARDPRLCPLDAPDWRKLVASTIESAWQRVQVTIDWTNPGAAGKEAIVKANVARKLNDRFRSWRAKLHRLYYLPFEYSAERFNIGDKDERINGGQWRNLVAHWDEKKNKAKKNGHEPDRVTFFTITHTRGPNRQPVDEESIHVMTKFQRLEEEARDNGDEVTAEVRNQIYTQVMGPEKRNSVRGYVIRVSWVDVPGVVTEQRGLAKEVTLLREAYEEQRKVAAEAEERINLMRQEAVQAEERLKREAQEAAERLKQKLRAEAEENLKVAKAQMLEQMMMVFTRSGLNLDMNTMGVVVTAHSKEGCGSALPESTGCMRNGPSGGTMPEIADCLSENSG